MESQALSTGRVTRCEEALTHIKVCKDTFILTKGPKMYLNGLRLISVIVVGRLFWRGCLIWLVSAALEFGRRRCRHQRAADR